MRIAPVIAALALAAAALPLTTVSAQRGPGCVRTSPVPPRFDGDPALHPYEEDIRPGVVFRCTLRRGQQPVRMVVRADPEFNVAVEVGVYRPAGSARPAQVLVLDDARESPRRNHPVIEGVDLNGDGWMDLKVRSMTGATGNESYDVFMYSPARSRFVKDTIIGKAGPLTPIGNGCVLSSWKMSMADNETWHDCWRGGRWVSVRLESHAYLPGPPARYVHTVRVRRGGRLRTVLADTTLARP